MKYIIFVIFSIEYLSKRISKLASKLFLEWGVVVLLLGLKPRTHAGIRQHQQLCWPPLKDGAVKLQLSAVHNIYNNRASETLKDQHLIGLWGTCALQICACQGLIPIWALVPLGSVVPGLGLNYLCTLKNKKHQVFKKNVKVLAYEEPRSINHHPFLCIFAIFTLSTTMETTLLLLCAIYCQLN